MLGILAQKFVNFFWINYENRPTPLYSIILGIVNIFDKTSCVNLTHIQKII